MYEMSNLSRKFPNVKVTKESTLPRKLIMLPFPMKMIVVEIEKHTRSLVASYGKSIII